MLIESKHFGKVEIPEEEVIFFPEGIPGFSEIHRYILLEEKDSPFLWLQAIDKIEPCFIVINPKIFYPNYKPHLASDILESLEIKDKEQLIFYTIVVIPEDITQMRTNLQAPLVISMENKRARQVVLNQPEYQLRHYIFQDLKGGGADAGPHQKAE